MRSRSIAGSRSRIWSRCIVGGADRDKLDPILDACVAVYVQNLDEDGAGRVQRQGQGIRAKLWISSPRSCPTAIRQWEKLSIFLNFLIPKLPAPKEEDLSKGVLEAIDMDSYRVEAQAALKMAMDDADAEIEPVPTRRWRSAKASRKSTSCRTSSRRSTTCSATSSGRMATRSTKSSPRIFRPA